MVNEEIRKTIVKLYAKGKTQEEISNLLDIPQSTVSYWIVRHRETGSVKNRPRSGRPAMIAKAQRKQLNKELLGDPPSRYGGESFGWTTKAAIDYVAQKYGVKYSMRRMQELFHKFGLSLITPRTEHKRDSSVMRTVYRDDFKKNSRKNIWIAPSSTLTKHRSD